MSHVTSYEEWDTIAKDHDYEESKECVECIKV